MEEDAGPSRLTPRDADAAATGDGSARHRRRWLIAVASVLAVLAAGVAVSGVAALRAHRSSTAVAAANAAAVMAAKDCIAATQPADVTALPISQRKLDECATGEFKTQAAWYSAILTEAYQAQNLHVRLPGMDAAVERTNDDGSITALVVFRATISQEGAPDRENSYRVRVKLVRENGQFKVAKLDQVAK
ncbi:Mce protein [Mycobacterium sp. SM1]|uniref:Mce protein n=1 Tax=Mycobacterium sp. SM1 TaxID=2816243 RepID=UPI001BCBDDDB|nr:Mce protein [Mycobacterium sp. SM1]MBS4727945.1 Mce protein [Mycobacterium sp. SM1]